MRAVEDHANAFERDQAAADHLVQPGKQALDALGILDDLHDNGQVLRQAQYLVGVVAAGGTVAGDAAQHGGAAESFVAKEIDQRVIERSPVPLVRFSDVDAHQGSLAFNALPARMPTIIAARPPSTLAPM